MNANGQYFTHLWSSMVCSKTMPNKLKNIKLNYVPAYMRIKMEVWIKLFLKSLDLFEIHAILFYRSDPVIPMYYAPDGEEGYTRSPPGSVFLWGQAVFIIAQLLTAGLLHINELDTIRRYLPSYNRPRKGGRYSAFQVCFVCWMSAWANGVWQSSHLPIFIESKLRNFIHVLTINNTGNGKT